MQTNIYLGMGLLVLAGIMSGTCVIPMKYATKWRWESIWLLFNGLALVAIPTVTVIITSPQAWQAYRAARPAPLIGALLLGLGWGFGAALCGISYTMLGIGLGMTIVLGLSATVGSALPLAILYPGKLLTTEALALYLAIGVMISGLVLSATAGKIRQSARSKDEITTSADLKAFGKGDIRIGVAIAIAAGIFSSMFNLALIFGDDIRASALRLGATPSSAVNTLWLPVTTSGFVGILIYCSYLLTKNRAWLLYFQRGTASHWFYVLLMAALYIGSISVYGIGTTRVGQQGAIIGFPAYMSTMIVTGNIAGLLTGEWRNSPRRAYAFGVAGIVALILSTVIIAATHKSAA